MYGGRTAEGLPERVSDPWSMTIQEDAKFPALRGLLRQSSIGAKCEPATALTDDAMVIVGMVSSSVRRRSVG
jgi:hypothetical protein